MPGRNGTGPQGQGSMTGRGLGNCIKKVDEINKKSDSESFINVFRRIGQGQGKCQGKKPTMGFGRRGR